MSQSKELSRALPANPLAFDPDETITSHFADQDHMDAAVEEMGKDDGNFETWLRTVGGPAYDHMVADPSCGIPAEEVLRGIRERSQSIPKQSA